MGPHRCSKSVFIGLVAFLAFTSLLHSQTKALGTVTISGSERGGYDCPNGATSSAADTAVVQSPPDCTWVYDSGRITISVNAVSKFVTYGRTSTASALALALKTAIQNDPAFPVNATVAGTVITLTAKIAGSAGNYPLSVVSYTDWPEVFSTPSFTATRSGPTLTGGSDGVPAVPVLNQPTSGANGTTATITWTDVAAETAYYLERCTGANCTTNFTPVGSPLPANTTTYLDPGLTPGSTYGYHLRASNAAGSSAWSTPIKYVTMKTKPVDPTNLTGTFDQGTVSINLVWSDNATDETGYVIERCSGSGCVNFGTLNDSLPPNSTAYTDSLIATNTIYRYRVKAVNGVGSSGYATSGDIGTNVSPTISGFSPVSGPVGTTVTITGSGFGPTPAGGTVAFNGANATINTWGDSTISVQVPDGATSGPITIITTGGQSTSTTSFTVSPNAPHIASLSPNQGGVTMEVSVQGTGFGNDPSSASVLFNGLPAPVLSWSDQSVTVTVPEELEDYGGGTVSVIVIAGSLQSNVVQFALTEPLMISPKLLTLVPGQSWVLQVLDSDGAELTGVDWSVADDTVLEILQGESSTRWNVTAKAAGTSKVIATLGDRRGTAKVDSVLLQDGEQLATGTVIWAAPPLKGGQSWNVVRSNGAVDAPEYFVEEYEPGSASRIRAFTATGQQTWVWPLADSTSDAWPAIAGASNDGGVFAFSMNYGLGEISLVKIDKAGHESWRHRADSDEQFAVHPDGTVFIVDDDSVVALDAAGNQRFTAPLPASTESLLNLGKMDYQDAQGNTHWADVCKPGEAQTSSDTGFVGSFTIDENGVVYLPVEVTTNVLDAMPCQFKYKNNVTPPEPEDFFVDQHGDQKATYQYSVGIQLLRMNSTGLLGSTTLDSRSASGTDWNTQVDDLVLGSGGVIPSGNGGALVTAYHRQASHWWGGGGTAGYAFAYNTSAGTSYQLPIRNVSNLFLDANGTAYADYYWGNTVAAFDAVTGDPKFAYTNPSGYLSVNAILEDGLLAHSNQRSSYGDIIKLNLSGNPVSIINAAANNMETQSTQAENSSLLAGNAVLYLQESGDFTGGFLGQVIGKIKGSQAYQTLSKSVCRVFRCNDHQQSAPPDIIRVPLKATIITRGTDATVTEQTATDKLKAAQRYWRSHADIEIEWNNSFSYAESCDRNYWQFGCQENQELWDIRPASLPEFARRFCDPVQNDACSAFGGSHVIFVGGIYEGSGVRGYTPQLLNYTALPILATGMHLAHEMGHEFRLGHRNSVFDRYKLMCGETFTCEDPPGSDAELDPQERQDARWRARQLSGSH